MKGKMKKKGMARGGAAMKKKGYAKGGAMKRYGTMYKVGGVVTGKKYGLVDKKKK
tara:strand:+ start:6221 stop:6385 length:165 start_codon:yes stop_codon:yes gene_type:complete